MRVLFGFKPFLVPFKPFYDFAFDTCNLKLYTCNLMITMASSSEKQIENLPQHIKKLQVKS